MWIPPEYNDIVLRSYSLGLGPFVCDTPHLLHASVFYKDGDNKTRKLELNRLMVVEHNELLSEQYACIK